MPRPSKTILAWLMAGLVLLLAAVPALAQKAAKTETFTPQVTGVLGSPDATTTIDGKQLPPPPPKFGGKIERNAAQSKPWWPPRVEPPKGAPNILLIMTDDVGFAAPSTFGGVIPTPALDRIAQMGLRYTNFHSTSLCSPTPGGADYRAQPPLGGLRRGGGAGHRLSGLRQLHHPGQGHHRQDPQGQRLSHLLVRQGPQHPDLSGEPGRAL